MQKVKTGLWNERNAAFVAFYAKNIQPYKDYHHAGRKLKQLKTTYVLMMGRSDGTLGFIGGMVEEGESLEEAAYRETYEEVHYKINPYKLMPVTTYNIFTDFNAHLFAYDCENLEELKQIYRQSVEAEHFISETTGLIFVPMTDFNSKGNGFTNIAMGKMFGSVREELFSLRNYLK